MEVGCIQESGYGYSGVWEHYLGDTHINKTNEVENNEEEEEEESDGSTYNNSNELQRMIESDQNRLNK